MISIIRSYSLLTILMNFLYLKYDEHDTLSSYIAVLLFTASVILWLYFVQENSEWADHTNVLGKRNAVENVYQWACG